MEIEIEEDFLEENAKEKEEKRNTSEGNPPHAKKVRTKDARQEKNKGEQEELFHRLLLGC